MGFFVGTSGWQYVDWRHRFYPARLPQREWLAYHSARFATVEVNAAFYRLPSREVFERWREIVPPGTVVAVKASRFLTHIKRLRDPEEPVGRLLERAAGLGDRLGPVLLQLPPNLPGDPAALARTLAGFPRTVRVAVEPRHDSWWTDETRSVLEDHGAALCWADRRGAEVTPLWRTADWGYLRLHEGPAPPWPSYDEATLARWSGRLTTTWRDDEDVVVYTNNDPGGAALRDAVTLGRMLRERGRTVGRVPDPAEVDQPVPLPG